MAKLKRITVFLLGIVIFCIVSVLGFYISSNSLVASSQESTELIEETAIQTEENTTQVEEEITEVDEQQDTLAQQITAQDNKPRECGRVFITSWYVEDPVWDEDSQSWSCCRYADGEPDCPTPPEN